MTLTFKKLRSNAVIPTRGTPDSAGLDLRIALPESGETLKISNESSDKTCTILNDALCNQNCVIIPPHSTILFPTGLAVESSVKDVALLVYPRSGLAVKKGLILANSVAVIDSDYRGEICIPLHNNSQDHIKVHDNERVAQLIVTPVLFPTVCETTEDLSDTIRGTGGFGSTGTE